MVIFNNKMFICDTIKHLYVAAWLRRQNRFLHGFKPNLGKIKDKIEPLKKAIVSFLKKLYSDCSVLIRECFVFLSTFYTIDLK